MIKNNLTAAALLGALVLASCESKERLYIYNWTYYTPPGVLEKFEQEYNIEVIEDNFDSNESMYTKIKAGGADFDIVFPSCDYTKIMIDQGMLSEIDHSRLVNLKNIDPLVLKQADYDPEMRYSVPYYWGAAGITVNTEKIPEFERSWALLGQSGLAGRVTMLDDPREVFGDALKFLGYSVNTQNPEEIVQAVALIKNQWLPNIHRFDAEAFAKNYATGSFWVVQGYPEGIFEEISGNTAMLLNTEFFIPQEGGPAYIDSMCILQDAKNIDAAHKFIDFIHRPEIYAEFCDTFRFPATVNIPARDLLKMKPMYQVEDLMNTELKKDVGEALTYYTTAWQELR
ncbi:MAG: extracellular solute-binding protein [Spirochaetaceae bacterium]|jgi:spermidine/putrescine transport system substrate-binding protein|nr:extracellular solute-binding protein [Spirochaetaceae bacterium]